MKENKYGNEEIRKEEIEQRKERKFFEEDCSRQEEHHFKEDERKEIFCEEVSPEKVNCEKVFEAEILSGRRQERRD
ncbi:MAG TPA: hypothetical protein VGG85_03630 [Terracidiphilus sp.]